MVVVVPRGAAPGIIMLRNAQWPGMHLAIAKGGNFSVVSSRTQLYNLNGDLHAVISVA